MHSVDASFRLKKQALAASRRRVLVQKTLTAIGTLLLLALTVGFYFTSDYWLSSVYDEELQPVDDAYRVPADIPVYVPAIIDLAGDPIWITLSSESGPEGRLRSITPAADAAEADLPARIELLADTMVSASEHFMTTIPATQQDFAFFQAQRAVAATQSAPMLPDRVRPSVPLLSEGRLAPFADPAAGWGETIDAGDAALPTFRKTEVENNTSLALVEQQSERYGPIEDFFIRVLVSRSLESVITENQFTPEEAEATSEALKRIFDRETVEPGYVVALRGHRTRRDADLLSLMQVSIYAESSYIGTLARDESGAFVSGVDPWIRDDLLNRSGIRRTALPGRQYRLLDAIYSTAARNNVPTEVIGEAIMYLSRVEDLNAFAGQSDRLILLYSDASRGAHGVGGRVLYISVRGAERGLECYVFKQDDGDFACASGDARARALAHGMITPVNGVLTSAFGPRRHPILKTVRVHKGVDWMAPVGTPILAAFDGVIAFRGDGGGYGNLVRISHEGGRETRYAHMQRFAEGMGVGDHVRAGDVIGYVGTTGLSTGPHLHFELHQEGVAIDPLGTVIVAESDRSAVEQLVDSIIRVESAGNPRAKNPLSTATGLGQFIESTWMRMMNTYRPDLAQTLSRAQLLSLRFDPTISREMVRNLAREGEAYLRSRGHNITAGRLYLCHFLGMEGAHIVLSAEGKKHLVDVLGVAVIKANPFLSGKDVSYVVNWAEVKMRGRSARSARQPEVQVSQTVQASPELERYKAAISEILKSEEASL